MSVQHGVERLENLVAALQRSRMQFQRSLMVARTPDQITGSRTVVEVIDLTLAEVQGALADIKVEPKP